MLCLSFLLYLLRYVDSGRGLSLSPIMGRFNSLRTTGKTDAVAVIEYQYIEAATNNFSENNVLGQGGRGRVYKARFNEKSLAAVKRIDDRGQDAEREFEVFFRFSRLTWISIFCESLLV